MNYFASLLDKDFNSLSSGVYSQYPVSSFDLKRKAQEFDSMTVTFKKMENSRNGVYIAIFDQYGSLFYLALCGIPQTKGEETTVNAVDVRRVLNQTLYVNYEQIALDCANICTVSYYYSALLYLAAKHLGSSSIGIDYGVDVLPLNDIYVYKKGGKYDMACAVDNTSGIKNIWSVIQDWNQRLGIVVVAMCSLNPETGYKKIEFVALPINMLISFSTNDFESVLSYSTTGVNMTQVLAYNDKTSVVERYCLLSNNDISETYYGADGTIAQDNLDIAYTDSDTFGTFNGANQYKGMTRREFLTYPCVCKEFAPDVDSDATSDEISKAKAKATSDALNALDANRYQDSLSIKIDSAMAKRVFNCLFENETTGETYPFYYAFENVGKISGYLKADTEYFKLLPVSMIETKFDNSGLVSKTITFGYLSDYAWLKGI